MERSKDWMEGSVQIFYPKFNREELIQAVREKLEDLNKKLPLQLVILFGSYAKGNYSVASDADLQKAVFLEGAV